MLNLAGVPLVGLAAYLLTQGIGSLAAILSRIAVAACIPIYVAFDALAGIGTGTLVELANRLAPNQSAAFEPILARTNLMSADGGLLSSLSGSRCLLLV